MASRVQIRRDTLSNWTKYDPILMDGEVGLVAPDDKPNIYTKRVVGDGKKKFSELPLLGFSCLQETGNSPDFPMSQDAVTKELGKIKNTVGSATPYVLNLKDISESSSSEDIDSAIGGWDNLLSAIKGGRMLVAYMSVDEQSRCVVTASSYKDNKVTGLIHRDKVASSENTEESKDFIFTITNTDGTLSYNRNNMEYLNDGEYPILNTKDKTILGAVNELKKDADLKQPKSDSTLQTSDKTIVGAINELKASNDSKQPKLTAGTGIEITPQNTINVTLDTTVFKVVASLPESPAAGDENKIHLVPAESTEEGNIYTEYVYVNGKWEEFGTYRSEVDLTPYMKKTDAEATYQKITDNTLATTAKTVVGAINELKSSVDTNTGNVTRIDRAVGNPVIEEVDLEIAQNDKCYTTIGNINNLTNAAIYQPISLNKGDILRYKINGGSGTSILSEVSNIGWVSMLQRGESLYKDYAFLATKDMQVVLSKSSTTTPVAYIIKSPFNTAISDNSYMQYLHKVYEEYGAVYNSETGYWEYGDLKDMTEEDCFLAAFYALDAAITADNPSKLEGFTGALTNRGYHNKNRTYFAKNIGMDTFAGSTFYIATCFAHNNSLEYIKLLSRNDIRIKSCSTTFYRCLSLRTIDTIFIADSLIDFQNAFFQCYKLKTIKIRGLKSPVSFQDSPLLSYESLNYLVTNAANTASITVTVHPTTYSYLTGTAQPTEEVGGTTEEWQALVTTAQGKQISFAQPAKTLEVEPLE